MEHKIIKTTKYERLYGMRLRDLAKKYNTSIPFWEARHKEGTVEQTIEEAERGERFKHKVSSERWLKENNPNWNGGKSVYTNHALMKENRIKKLILTNNKCEICGEKANRIHHLNENKSDHSIENLAVLCDKCHWIIHSDRKNKTSKYIRIYGKTMLEIARQLNKQPSEISILHRNNKLMEILNEYKK